MRVQFVQPGRILGAVKGCELDTTTLASSVAAELKQLVQASGLSVSLNTLSATGRDLQQYEITIEDGKSTVSVAIDDATVPQSAKPLVSYLKKRSRPVPLD